MAREKGAEDEDACDEDDASVHALPSLIEDIEIVGRAGDVDVGVMEARSSSES